MIVPVSLFKKDPNVNQLTCKQKTSQ